jgi:hypothetical protein
MGEAVRTLPLRKSATSSHSGIKEIAAATTDFKVQQTQVDVRAQ